MKNPKFFAKSIALVLVQCMLVTAFAGCGQSGKSSKDASSTPTTGSTDKAKPLVKLSFYNYGTVWPKAGVQDSPVFKEIENKLGIQLDFVNHDDSKFNVMLAGGDLPDIVSSISLSYEKQFIEGGNAIVLDSLLETNGKDIKKNAPSDIQYNKKYHSNGTGKLYFLNPQLFSNVVSTQKAPIDFLQTAGHYVRWDYYKELGYPDVKNDDDLLKVLAQMKAKHPTTTDGKPVYGVSGYNDGTLWAYTVPIFWGLGVRDVSNTLLVEDDKHSEDIALGPNQWFFKCMEYFFKANQLGLLDPETFTQKVDNYKTKTQNLQLLEVSMRNYRQEGVFAQKGIDGGFEMIPGSSPNYLVSGGKDAALGRTGKMNAITKSCKYPDRAMDLLNYLYTPEGARTVLSGVKGVNWDIVNGKAEMTDDTIKLYNTDKDFQVKTGIGFFSNTVGLHGGLTNPTDNSYLDLLSYSPKVYQSRMTNMDKDYVAKYNATFPSEALYKEQDKGNMKLVVTGTMASGFMDQPNDDVKRVVAKEKDILNKAAPKLALAKDKAQFDAEKQSTIQQLKDAGMDSVVKFYDDAYKKAQGIRDEFMK